VAVPAVRSRTLARFMVGQGHRFRLMSLIAIYLGIALWYAIMTPPGEGVDELPHFDYVLYLRTHQHMSVYVDGAPVSVWMAHHPPLYYSMGAGVTLPFSSDDREDVLQPNPHFRW